MWNTTHLRLGGRGRFTFVWLLMAASTAVAQPQGGQNADDKVAYEVNKTDSARHAHSTPLPAVSSQKTSPKTSDIKEVMPTADAGLTRSNSSAQVGTEAHQRDTGAIRLPLAQRLKRFCRKALKGVCKYSQSNIRQLVQCLRKYRRRTSPKCRGALNR